MRFFIIIHVFIILHLKANILSFIYQTYRWKIIVHIYTWNIHSQNVFYNNYNYVLFEKKINVNQFFFLQFLNHFLRSNFFSSFISSSGGEKFGHVSPSFISFLRFSLFIWVIVSFWTILHQDKLGEVPQVGEEHLLTLTRQVQLIIFPKSIKQFNAIN